ncbi:helix-turn-helix domain-containing protein [Flagellimonas meishanensis]|uniref:helix-turn-helix domain-containing protein n=1 Tax=Flagellimonas meishanensis TaxID=2873264 RepID=UPI001CA6853B|nr:helix-turn-helix domain-containing protein [[Muricauda] meishanensis]
MYIIKQLRRKKNISQTDLAREIGVSLRTIQLYEKKDANIPIKNLTRIADYFELTIAELYLHEVNDMGESYIRKQPFTKYGSVFYPLDHGKYLIMAPLVLMEQYSGYLEKLKTDTSKKTPFQIGFVIDFLEDQRYTAFEIAGDSMNDLGFEAIPNKAIVLGLGLEKETFTKDMDDLWYKSYVLVCQDRIICKQVVGYNNNNGTIKCHNLNTSPEYKDFELSLNDVLQVFKVIKKQL